MVFLILSLACAAPPTPADWPTYNHDAKGWRYNAAESELSPDTVGGLVELWRYPPDGSDDLVGAVQMTPAVVDGEVYFGTLLNPTFYKLSRDGELAWKFRKRTGARAGGGFLNISAAGAFAASPLVTDRFVYCGDITGSLYCLDRDTGREAWHLDTRADDFPDAHPSNAIFASPVLADGKLIVAGGAYEHGDAARPGYRCCSGRGFVTALDPDTGRLLWKYDVGPPAERFDPPVVIKDAWGEHVFHFGPSTSSVWCTPSFDARTRTLYFGTDVHNSPRRPTEDDPKNYTRHSAAVVALDARDGSEKWVTQINPGDVWNYTMRAWDPVTGLYKDQSIGDTPKIYSVPIDGRDVDVVGCGCKNGGFFVFRADDGELVGQTPLYRGPPVEKPKTDPRTLALPGAIGGLQTGCATDGRSVFTNGIDANLLLTGESSLRKLHPPTGGRVVSIAGDARSEHWRHERPRLAEVGGWPNVGDAVASGVAVANGVVYFTTTSTGQLVALDAASGELLKSIDLGPAWCGPSVSRGRVYVGLGNVLFSPPGDSFFPKRPDGGVACFGLVRE